MPSSGDGPVSASTSVATATTTSTTIDRPTARTPRSQNASQRSSSLPRRRKRLPGTSATTPRRILTFLVALLLTAHLIFPDLEPFAFDSLRNPFSHFSAAPSPTPVPPNVPRAEVWQSVASSFLSVVPRGHLRISHIINTYLHRNNANATALLTIHAGRPTLHIRNVLPHYRNNARANSVHYVLHALMARTDFPPLNLTVLLDLSAGMRRPPAATFSTARHFRSWYSAIPVPLAVPREAKDDGEFPLRKWDAFVANVTKTWGLFPWYRKRRRAVFRDKLRMCIFKLGSCNVVPALLGGSGGRGSGEGRRRGGGGMCQVARRWQECAVGVLYKRVRRFRHLFDVAFTHWIMRNRTDFHQLDGAPHIVDPMPWHHMQRYKFVINVGSIHETNERLRALLFLNSALVHHMSESQQFFTPLLQPWKHFIPVSANMSDIVPNVRYAMRHDRAARAVRDTQNAFAYRFLTEGAMLEYWRVVLVAFARAQAEVEGSSGRRRSKRAL